jgi:hypothetical protein
MPCDLDVDTDHIRLAGSAARDAAECFAQPNRLGVADAVRGAVSHGSAAVRQTLSLAARRSEEGLAAADRLSAIAQGLADALQSAAVAFDRAETLCSAGF